ncbi:MAG: filamentous hemagglutinin N-terminal domain-containing protein, partial [Chthoniobacterales bacterium]
MIAVMLCVSMSGGNFAYADILRGGAGRGNSPAGRTSEGRTTTPGAETAAAARLRAQDRLARTTQAISAMRAVQSSAQSRSSASVRAAGPVPDGLRPGGLQLAVGANARLSGALAPEANGRTVTIRQTEAQAVLHWETFNVSKRTTVYFDQKNGGVDSAKWIAFNKIIDPSGKPSQILGSIRADGQVYILNPNGIIFGPGSQVNARSLVASALPINDNLVERGLLSQAAGNPEFLFSTTQQGSFIPPAAFTKSGDPGNVVVDVGARLSSPVSADGNGGRIILAGANVENRGVISTPAGQTILAAGRQVGFEAHPSSDPSLRGLDVFIGEVGKQEGTVRNEGLIEIPTGSLTMAGKRVEQLGAVESSTTVS